MANSQAIGFTTDTDDDEEVAVEPACNWCGDVAELAPDKPYCVSCQDGCFTECARCHRPFPDQKHFAFDKTRCNACFKKYSLEKEKRNNKKSTPTPKKPVAKKRSAPKKMPENKAKRPTPPSSNASCEEVEALKKEIYDAAQEIPFKHRKVAFIPVFM